MNFGRILMGMLYIAAGAAHFAATRLYASIVPSYFPARNTLVLVSGAAEIAGGLGVLAPVAALRRSAAWGLVALLIAVLPANVSMAAHPAAFPYFPAWALWARLPLQLPLLYWAWIYTRSDENLPVSEKKR